MKDLLSEFWDDDELAEQLGKKPSTIKRWYREAREGHALPPYSYNGRQRIHHKVDTLEWMRAGGLYGSKVPA